jgi:hypothetical protein
MSSLAVVQRQKTEAVRRAFAEAVWSDASPERLLELAVEVKMPLEKADNLIREIENLKAMKERLAKWPALRQKALDARGTFENVRAECQTKIDDLETKISKAAIECDNVEGSLREMESIASTLLFAEIKGLAPKSELSTNADERRAAESEMVNIHKRWIISVENVRRAKRYLEDWQARLDDMTENGIRSVQGPEDLREVTLQDAKHRIQSICPVSPVCQLA